MSDPVEPKMTESKAHDGALEAEREVQVENAYDNNLDENADHKLDEKAKIADYKADAIEAENAEHNMTVLQAVQAYPMATFWAFVMSFTIVSCLLPCFARLFPPHLILRASLRTRTRSHMY